MSRPGRPEERFTGTGCGTARGDASSTRSVAPAELHRDAQQAAADLFVFAPIGFVKRVRALLPDLIREGRSTAASARTIGKFVTPIARTQGTKLVKAKVADLTRAVGATRSAGSREQAEPPEKAGPPAAPAKAGTVSLSAAPAKAGTRRVGGSSAKAKGVHTGPKGAKTPTMPEGSMSAGSPAPRKPLPQEPFAGYDHLGSAAVVARLGELSRSERAAVRTYEAANRNRRTILGRLDQLDPSQ